MYYCCKGIQFESKKFNFVCGLGMRLNLIDTTTHLVLLSVPYNVVTTHSRYLTAYPLTKRNGLVNQVEILGLAHTLVTFKTILQQTPSKEVPMLKWI